MNRSVVRSAFGRCRFEANASYPTSTPRSFFSTTSQWQADDNGSSDRRPASGRQRSAAAASELGSLKSDKSDGPAFRRVDVRSLKASPPGPSGVTAKPRIINVRSLRPRGGAAGSDGNFFRKDFGAPGGQRTPGRFSGRGGAGARGRGGRGGRGGRKPFKKDRKKEDNEDDKTYKLTWTPEQKEFIQREEQGVVTAYTPSATLDDLAGYMPAIATDSALTKVGSAMRGMRILAGGRPYCADGYYNDRDETLRKFKEEKKPVFFDDLKEKKWLNEFSTSTSTRPIFKKTPFIRTQIAIVRSAIGGNYRAPQFATVEDTMATLARYHIKDYSYKRSDGEKFDAKVLSLLPGGGKTAGAKQA